MRQTNTEQTEKLKEAIHRSYNLSEEEKATSIKVVEEWAREDKALGVLTQKLYNVSTEIEPILAEIGII